MLNKGLFSDLYTHPLFWAIPLAQSKNFLNFVMSGVCSRQTYFLVKVY